MFGLTDATLAVDCKLWKKKLDVTDVGSFLTYLDDVGADLGMLMPGDGERSLREVGEEALTAAACRSTSLQRTCDRWRNACPPRLEVTDGGRPKTLKILVSTEAEPPRRTVAEAGRPVRR